MSICRHCMFYPTKSTRPHLHTRIVTYCQILVESADARYNVIINKQSFRKKVQVCEMLDSLSFPFQLEIPFVIYVLSLVIRSILNGAEYMLSSRASARVQFKEIKKNNRLFCNTLDYLLTTYIKHLQSVELFIHLEVLWKTNSQE